MIKIIHRHLFRELIVPFALSLIVFTLIFLVSRILQLTELLVNKGVSAVDILKLFIYATPYFFVFTIPLSVLFAVVLSFIRLSADNEITALKGAGLSLYQMLPAVVVLTVFGFLLTISVSVFVLPRANTALRDHAFALAYSRAEVAITERLFIDDFEGLVLYIDGVDHQATMLNRVFVSDERDPAWHSLILARRGRLLRDPATRSLTLRLEDGAIDRLSRDRLRTETITFAAYDLRVDLRQMVKARQTQGRHREELGMGELRQKMAQAKAQGRDKDYYLHLMVFHERLSIPFACLCLGFLGVPLGIQSRFRKTSSGLILAVSAFLSYYLLYSAAKSLGETGLYPPVVGLWLPNMVFGALALYLMIQTSRERPWTFFVFLADLRRRIEARQSR